MKTTRTEHGYQVTGTDFTVRKQPRTSSLSVGWEIGVVLNGTFHPTSWAYTKKSALEKIQHEK